MLQMVLYFSLCDHPFNGCADAASLQKLRFFSFSPHGRTTVPGQKKKQHQNRLQKFDDMHTFFCLKKKKNSWVTVNE